MVTEYHPAGNLSKIIKGLHVKFIGGRLCLDFVNTVTGRDDSGAVLRDKIERYEDLLGWSLLAGTIDEKRARAMARVAARNARNAAGVLLRALRLREALFSIFKSAIDKHAPRAAATDVLRREISIARANQYLAPRENGFIWKLSNSVDALDNILWPVSLSAAELLTSGGLARLGQCSGADCRWLFLDMSRNHRRQWCDMQDCGNRAKVRRFRERQQQA